MSPWMFWVFDVLVGTLAAGGVAFLLAAWFASRPSFVARVAQGRVSQEAPSPLTVWARRASAAALESLGSTTESVARRLALAGMAPEVSVFRLHQALDSWSRVRSSPRAPPRRCGPRLSPCVPARLLDRCWE